MFESSTSIFLQQNKLNGKDRHLIINSIQHNILLSSKLENIYLYALQKESQSNLNFGQKKNQNLMNIQGSFSFGRLT